MKKKWDEWPALREEIWMRVFLLSSFIEIENEVYSGIDILLELLVIEIKRFEIMIKTGVKNIIFKSMHS